MSSRLGDVVSGSNSVVFSALIVNYMYPLSLSKILSVLVGNYLGESKPLLAKRAAYLGVILITAVLLVVVGILFVCRGIIPYMYTNDQKVVDLSSGLLRVVCLVAIFDGLNGTLSGILRGAGRPNPGFIANAVCQVGITYPLAIVVGFVLEKGIYAIWLSMLLGIFCVVLVIAVYLFFLNFDKLSEEAVTRTKPEEIISEFALMENEDENENL